MSLIGHVKKYLIPGLIGQLIIAALAVAASTFQSLNISLTAVLGRYPPPIKYGPPFRPSGQPVPKYGMPTDTMHFPAHFDAGTLFSGDYHFPRLAMTFSLAIYAWTLLSWVLLGSILYLKNRGAK